MLRVGIHGINGRMGRRIALLILNDGKTIKLSGAVDTPTSPVSGKDVGTILDIEKTGVVIGMDPLESFKNVDVIIDFTGPEATLNLAEKNVVLRKPLVIGTTGFSESQKKELFQLLRYMPVVYAANMSLGVNLIANIVKQAARVLPNSFNIKIVETHHTKKLDAPSGTAIFLQKSMESGNPNYKKRVEIESIREGDVVGEHTVSFDSDGEKVEITHIAKSRDTFAVGAIKAAEWVATQAPGLYNMFDVLGLGKLV